ncbi:TetR/AcrR family transcriptional regulator [Nocardiopsis sp. CNT-189]|uniref:TetR/AcrR family transcriptional regulator n=1 Tax=Nocardiopsis oceanisediminis TaxID=2816862 RepID=UPI003B387166
MRERPSQKHRSGGPSGPGEAAEGLRADARENRARILRAAREAFAEQGIDVPVTAIARRAGVGVATLYRRFPTRDALVAESFAERFTACRAVLDRALADPDPWRGFCSFAWQLSAMQVADRGFSEAFLARFPGAVDHDRERARAEEEIGLLVERAKESGRVRPDVDRSDVLLLLLANCGVAAEAGPHAPAASRRLVGHLLRSFQADPSAPLPEPAPLDLGGAAGLPRR